MPDRNVVHDAVDEAAVPVLNHGQLDLPDDEAFVNWEIKYNYFDGLKTAKVRVSHHTYRNPFWHLIGQDWLRNGAG